MSAAQIPVVGIIGGIGSGKTSIANALGEFLSTFRIDADAVGHEVLNQEAVKAELKKAFGENIFNVSGEVDRPKLAELVFGKEVHHVVARKTLEGIVHPIIREFIEQKIQKIKDSDRIDVIILDAALLLEAGWDRVCDVVVFLEVAEHRRQERVLQRGWTTNQFKSREESQLPLAEKREQADVCVRNDGDLKAAASELSDWLQHRFSIPKNVLKTETYTDEHRSAPDTHP